MQVTSLVSQPLQRGWAPLHLTLRARQFRQARGTRPLFRGIAFGGIFSRLSSLGIGTFGFEDMLSWVFVVAEESVGIRLQVEFGMDEDQGRVPWSDKMRELGERRGPRAYHHRAVKRMKRWIVEGVRRFDAGRGFDMAGMRHNRHNGDDGMAGRLLIGRGYVPESSRVLRPGQSISDDFVGGRLFHCYQQIKL